MAQIFYEIDTENNQLIGYLVKNRLVIRKSVFKHKMIINSLEEYKKHQHRLYLVEGFVAEDLNNKRDEDLKFPILIKNDPGEIELIFENYQEGVF
jgi:hypothetical protein